MEVAYFVRHEYYCAETHFVKN